MSKLTNEAEKIAENLKETAKVEASRVLAEALLTKNTLNTSSDSMSTDIKYIQRDIGEIKLALKEMMGEFITKIEFEPIKRLVYGMVSLILIAVVGALLALVLQKR